MLLVYDYLLSIRSIVSSTFSLYREILAQLPKQSLPSCQILYESVISVVIITQHLYSG